MKIDFNNTPIELARALPLADFIQEQVPDTAGLLLEYNGEILTLEDASERELHDGDRIIALKIVGGG